MKLLKISDNQSINLDSIVSVKFFTDDDGYTYEVYLYLPIQLPRENSDGTDVLTYDGVTIWDDKTIEVTDEFAGYDRMMMYLNC